MRRKPPPRHDRERPRRGRSSTRPARDEEGPSLQAPTGDLSRLVLGKTQTLQVVSMSEHGPRLGWEGEDVLLPRTQAPEGLRPGTSVEVFLLTDSQDRLVATTRKPRCERGEFAVLEVVSTTRHGAFLDWGLDKDLFVPFAEQSSPFRQGELRAVFVVLHEATQRLMGSNRLGRHFDYDLSPLKLGQTVSLLLFQENQSGFQVIVDQRYRGIIYHSQSFKKLAIGQELRGWVLGLRDDGRLDIGLRRPGMGGVQDARRTLLTRLQEAGGFLPLHDGSSPDRIRAELQMSKKVFKKAVGGLYREGRLHLGPKGIRLKKPRGE